MFKRRVLCGPAWCAQCIATLTNVIPFRVVASLPAIMCAVVSRSG